MGTRWRAPSRSSVGETEQPNTALGRGPWTALIGLTFVSFALAGALIGASQAPTAMRVRATLATLFVVALVGCVDQGGPENCDTTEVRIEVAVDHDSMTPADPGVCRGQSVTIVIDSATVGVFHIHGYDAAVPATSIAPGEETRISFVADRSGQFPVELHPDDDPQGVGIGVFTVYEP